MQVYAVRLPAVAASLFELTGVKRCQHIAFQAPTTNANTAYWGDPSMQPFFVESSGSTELMPIPNLESLYIKGTAGDVLYVLMI